MKALTQVFGAVLFVVFASLLTAVSLAVGSTVAAIDSVPRKRHAH